MHSFGGVDRVCVVLCVVCLHVCFEPFTCSNCGRSRYEFDEPVATSVCLPMPIYVHHRMWYHVNNGQAVGDCVKKVGCVFVVVSCMDTATGQRPVCFAMECGLYWSDRAIRTHVHLKSVYV